MKKKKWCIKLIFLYRKEYICQTKSHSGQRGKRSYDRPLIFTKFFTFDDPSSPCVCFSACSGCTHRWHAASNSNACHFEMNRKRNLSLPKKKYKKNKKKYQKRKFDARTTPDTCRLFKTSQKMVRRVPTPVRPQRSRKLRLTKTPARRLDAAARYHEVLSLATLHNSSLSKLRVSIFLPLWNLLIIIIIILCFDSTRSSILTRREILENSISKYFGDLLLKNLT